MESDLRYLFNNIILDFSDKFGLAVCWPNTDFDPTTDIKPYFEGNSQYDVYLKVDIMKSDPEVLVVCNGGSRYTWICQVSIMITDGDGEVIGLRLADKLHELIPAAKKLQGESHCFQVMEPGNIIQPVPTGSGWYNIPVQFRIKTIK